MQHSPFMPEGLELRACGPPANAHYHYHACYPQEAECKKEMLDVKFMADTKIADSKRAFELQKSAFSEEVNIKVRSQRSPGIGLRVC